MSGGYPRYSLHQKTQLARTAVSSQHLKSWMTARGGDDKGIEVCHTNIDTEKWRRDRFDAAAVAKKWNVDTTRPVMLYAGRICDQKQPRVFAETIHQVAKKNPAFTVLVAGEGPGRWRNQRRQRAGIKALVGRRTRDVRHGTVGAGEPDEPVAVLGRIERLDLGRRPRLASRRQADEQRLGDLLGPAGLGLQQGILQISAELDVKEGAQENEDRREQARMPEGEPEADRPRVHGAGSSERL